MSTDSIDGLPNAEGDGKPIEDNKPQPITFKATYYPDGKLHVECPLLSNPMLLLGFLEFIKDGTKRIMEERGEENKPRIQPPPGSFLNGLRRKFK